MKSKRTLAALTLAVTMVVGLAVPAQAASFTDVKPSYWGYSAIEEAAQQGWLNGMGGGKFVPEGPVTGAQFIKMLMAAFAPEDIRAQRPGELWYQRYLEAADKYGIRNGAGLDSPATLDQGADRFTMAILLANLMNAAELHDTSAWDYAGTIPDWRAIPADLQADVAFVYGMGLITGMEGGSFQGHRGMTRAQAATVLCRAADVPELNGTVGTLSGSYQGGGQTPVTPPPAQDPASQITDGELLALANRDVMTQYNLHVGYHAGAYFGIGDYLGMDGTTRMYRVMDQKIQTMADVEALWYTYFAGSYPMPQGFRMFQGQVATACPGIGGDIFLDTIKVEKVLSRSGSTAVLQGWAYRWDWDFSQPSQRDTELRYVMTYENGQWKCSGFDWLY